jgi:hypothetical protein
VLSLHLKRGLGEAADRSDACRRRPSRY